MKHPVYIFWVLFGAVAEVCANPILVYDLPVISEVRINDNGDWFVELGGNGGVSSSNVFTIRPPCSTTICRIRVASLKKTYSTTLYFNSQGIAVITRSAITGIPSSEKVTIQPFDTIFVMDTTCHDSICQGRRWVFAVRPIKKDNSLVNACSGCGGNPFESSRPSIGQPGDYTTIYRLVIVNDAMEPVPDLYMYKYIYFSMLNASGYTLVPGGMSSGDIKVSLAERTISLAFSTISDNSSFPVRGPFGAQWKGMYIDSLYSRTDTVIYLPISSVLNPGNNLRFEHKSEFKFLIMPDFFGKTFTFTIASPIPVSGAVIKVFSIHGKECSIIDVPEIDKPGTHSFTMVNQKVFSKGLYLFRLIVGGNPVAANTVSIK
ncbi:MAG: hypothetical protein JXA18_09535 [Chitinispirillaceae bacterium]|nr:hypothetical protein [Chitinispirillaceae bacterium]